MDAHCLASSPAPVMFKSPSLKLGACHRRNQKQMPTQVRLVKIATRVLLEEIRNNVSVNDQHYSMFRLSESRRRSRTVRTKSSTLSSSGQKSALSESKSVMGRTPCSTASLSNFFRAASAAETSSRTIGFLCA